MISVLRPVSEPTVSEARSPAVYRSGLSSARRELQAGTARRHRTEAAATPAEARGARALGRIRSVGVAADVPAEIAPLAPTAELRTQQAGVRAALAELRQHRGPR